MNTSEKFRLRVSFNHQVNGIRFQLVDGELNTIYDEVGMKLDRYVAQGIYHLKISYIDYFQEKFFSVSDNTELKLDFDYPFTVPALDFKTTHEYYSLDAERFSLKATCGRMEHRPNFFFFAALYDPEKKSPVPVSKWLDCYTLFNTNKSVNVKLNYNNTICDNKWGKVCFSAFLQPGLYFLSYNDTSIQRIFPIYIYDKYQTQFFIRYSDMPDFVNSRIFYSDAGCFRQSAIEYLLLEKIIFSFSDFKNFQSINAGELENIKKSPYLVTLVNLLFQILPPHIAQQYKPYSHKSPVEDCKSLELPDLIYCKNDQLDVYPNSDKPPLLSMILSRYTHRHDNGQLLFKPASTLDRIVDNLHYDLFWTNFSKIEEPETWAKTYRPLLRTIHESPNAIVRTVCKAKDAVLDLWNPPFDDTLKYLVGKAVLAEGQTEAVTEMVNKIKDVSVMTKEFGLPPTTILRNYRKYTKYYFQIKETEPKKSLKAGAVAVITLVCLGVILGIGVPYGLSRNGMVENNRGIGVSDNQDDQSSGTKEFNKVENFSNRNTKQLKDLSLRFDSLKTNKTLDTIIKYQDLSELLSSYDSIGNRLTQSSYSHETANNFLRLAVQISDMLKSDSAYLTPYLRHDEVDSLKRTLARYITYCNAIQTSSKSTDIESYYKPQNTLLISSEIKGKLEQAYNQMLLKGDF